MGLQLRKQCTAVNQGVDGFEILAQVVELALDASLNFAATWSLVPANPHGSDHTQDHCLNDGDTV